jgi:alpha-1,3-rhamnosyl/mannosyltransferase
MRRIALDVGPARAQASGVTTYVRELALALDALAPDRVVPIGARRPLAWRSYLAWMVTQADDEARAAGCDLAHYTNAVAPIRSKVPFVLTIHDLSVIRMPRLHPASRLPLVPLLLRAARSASLVIVPSRATAAEVRRLLHVPAERLAVIPHAARTFPRSTAGESVLAGLGVQPGRYIVALGTLEPRKNGTRLLAAFEGLASEDSGLKLLFVGRHGWGNGRFFRALARSSARSSVVLAGDQPDASLAVLLSSCAVMAYPSLYEGFGLPVLEAMASNAPVVTSLSSSLPEVAGGAAVLVDPTDVSSIASGLREAMARGDVLRRSGLQRAASRSWLDVGRETLEAYDRALASPA